MQICRAAENLQRDEPCWAANLQAVSGRAERFAECVCQAKAGKFREQSLNNSFPLLFEERTHTSRTSSFLATSCPRARHGQRSNLVILFALVTVLQKRTRPWRKAVTARVLVITAAAVAGCLLLRISHSDTNETLVICVESQGQEINNTPFSYCSM